MKICDYDYITIISLKKFRIFYDSGYDYIIIVIDYNRLRLLNNDYSKGATDIGYSNIVCHSLKNKL